MTPTQAQIAAAAKAIMKTTYPSAEAQAEAALTAAAEVGKQYTAIVLCDRELETKIIERCAQVARASIIKNWGICPVPSALADVVDAAIHALKD